MYVRRVPIDYSGCFGGTYDADEALVVINDSSTKKIQLWDPSNSEIRHLGITWQQGDPDISEESWHWGRMAAVSTGVDSTLHSAFRQASGPTQVEIWKRADSGELTPMWTHLTKGDHRSYSFIVGTYNTVIGECQLAMAINMAQIVDIEAVASYQKYYDAYKEGYPAYKRVVGR
ncbi:hypothetical protein FRB99_008098 [Tulasnella sp. 403]|nr:hypothetical protein FRB99_008098 [Tulasnella sp. 403]